MKLKSSARPLRIVLLIGVVLLIFSSLAQTTQAPSAAAGLMGTNCSPLPAPDALRVNPVTPYTQALTQTVRVGLEHGSEIDIISEAGVTSLTGAFMVSSPVSITIPLSPTMVHHLTVAGQVQYPPGCYNMLYTMRDINGSLLTIQQLGLNNHILLPIVLRQ